MPFYRFYCSSFSSCSESRSQSRSRRVDDRESAAPREVAGRDTTEHFEKIGKEGRMEDALEKAVRAVGRLTLAEWTALKHCADAAFDEATRAAREDTARRLNEEIFGATCEVAPKDVKERLADLTR